MRNNSDDSSNSGYVEAPFEGISGNFTDITIMRESETNVVARAKRYGRWWLLKALRKELSTQEAYRQRLRKEMELMSQLQHPNIVTLVGLEEVEQLGHCIVMEYIDGDTLEHALEQATKSQQQKMAIEIMDAVEYLHSKGIVHRDLKPSNIMVASYGNHIKLVDFGLADSYSHTVLKQPAGTLRYMSPEQRQTPAADVRNDIYSLGVIFGQMNLGKAYNGVVKKCLQPASRRYHDIAQMRADLKRRQRRPIKIAVAATVIALAALLGATGKMASQMRQQKVVMERQEQQLKQQTSTVQAQQQRVNTLERETAAAKEIQEVQNKTMATLNDSLVRLTESNQHMRERQDAEETRRKVMEEMKKEAGEMLRNAYRKVGEQRLDRVNAEKKIGVMLSSAIEDEKQTFLKRIRPKLSDSEYIEISAYIENYCDQLATSTWGSLGIGN